MFLFKSFTKPVLHILLGDLANNFFLLRKEMETDYFFSQVPFTFQSLTPNNFTLSLPCTATEDAQKAKAGVAEDAEVCNCIS